MLVRIKYATRDLGNGVERGVVVGEWGDRIGTGAREFRGYRPGGALRASGSSVVYLFSDEVLSERKASAAEVRVFDETIYVCPRCGSEEIEIRAWVTANGYQYVSDYDEGGTYQFWCAKCEERGDDGHLEWKGVPTRADWKAATKGENCACEGEGDGAVTGWIHTNNEPPGIERCDTCKKYEDDDAAKAAHDAECGCDWATRDHNKPRRKRAKARRKAR